jgi:integrase
MATVKALVLKHHKKSDGSYNVKIRISHDRVSRYIDTTFFVSNKQINKKLEIKDNITLAQVEPIVSQYRQIIGELSYRTELMTCDQIVNHLETVNEKVDIIAFGRQHVDELNKAGKSGSATNFRSVVNSLEDFFGRKVVYITEINANMLRTYEKYLRTERKLTRQSHNKKAFTIISPPLSDSGLHNHMRDLRGLFNVARNFYNDEDLGLIRIPHYPFKKYKLIKVPETAKRNIDFEQLAAIKNYECETGTRPELARDLFLLSFYMCGTNSVDFYNIDKNNIVDGRLEYNRAKTKGKRNDQAFISIKIIEEAEPLLERFLGTLKKRFSTKTGLSSAISYGMRKISKDQKLPGITFYWARHTFATIARNTCRKTKDDVAMALNHIDEGRKTTDIYIEKDWKIVDEVQRSVVDAFIESLKPKNAEQAA